MIFKPQVVEAKMHERNDATNLYHVVARLQDNTHCRIIYNNGTKSISRLLKNPCPICRKDTHCKCLDRFVEEIASQVDFAQL
ncbi:hypothetical protein KIK04_18895 [Paenibacillus sp. 481]|nr:hypothetical protein KIK04_18895 [Paenibacillus sp. 481]